MREHVDGDFLFGNDMNSIVRAMASDAAVISGCEVGDGGTNDLSVSINAGEIYSGGSVSVASSTETLNAADSTNDRYDLITATSAGNTNYVAGTASSTPKAPSIPAGEALLAIILVRAGVSGVTNADINDARGVISVPAAYLADGSVTASKIATGAVGSSEVADGSLGTGDLSFDPATQTELNSHAGNANAHHPAPVSDVFHNRPSPGTTDRLFTATDVGGVWRDTGTAWEQVSRGHGRAHRFTFDNKYRMMADEWGMLRHDDSTVAMGSPTFTTTSKQGGGAVNLDDSRWEISPFTMPNRSEFAITVWMNPDWANMDSFARPLLLGSNGSAAWDFESFPGNAIKARVNNGTTLSDDVTEASGWNLYGLDFDGSTARLYRNGNLKDSAGASEPGAYDPLRIGGGSASDESYWGLFDDLRIYPMSLSSSAHSAIYNNHV